jgi:hypothetical protein
MSQPYDVPLFGDPEPAKTVRALSHKDRDDAANKIVWTRYKVSGIQCVDCVIEYPKGLRMGIGAANWMRVQGEDKRVLCWMHKAEYLARGDRGLEDRA